MVNNSTKRRPLIIANWKLNGTSAFVSELLEGITEQWTGVHQAEVVVCPAFVHIGQASSVHLAHSNIALGAQDCSQFEEGAYTGDVSAEMLHDLGCQFVITGHSERRRFYNETDALVARKFDLAHKALMTPILCVGETPEQREAGETLAIIKRQVGAVLDYCGQEKLGRCVIAYEPLWAVGTGVTATPDQAQEVHAFIRQLLGPAGQATRIIYGGSVKPENAEALFTQPDIDGALVGGAALKADDFIEICKAAEL
ncbi:triose-phosphate isomerase [Marinagarivorans algicola]|uniref:triose-phosphate isomerase n=1 Tax=Marinagarivorans algicola TaxID=1513270 RepID=UPI0006B9DBA4|nr:triose-phosphate isomerase [Marinagarivorans algicola]